MKQDFTEVLKFGSVFGFASTLAHMYLLLYCASQAGTNYIEATWHDGSGAVVVTTTPRRTTEAEVSSWLRG